jgi:4-amino-4-deoxy-L-arabinose transferase-like glycosyltransferase
MTIRSAQHLSRNDKLVGLIAPFLYVIALFRSASNLGFCRDESFYFDAAGRYAQWFHAVLNGTKGALEQPAIDGAWSANHEHPALVKSAFAFSWMLFSEKNKLIADYTTALRLPGMLFAALGLYVTYLFVARSHGRIAGVFASCALALMPRVFYNAHLACFDVAAMSMWAFALYMYARATEHGTWKHAILAGLVYGLLLETKHNAWLMPGVVIPHALLIAARGKEASQRVFRPLVCMATIGPLVFVALWPWLWHDTANRVREYVAFHMNHEYYNMEFLGVNYYGPPSPKGYAPLMILATVPTITLVLFALGLFDAVKRSVDGVRAEATVGIARLAKIRDEDVLWLLGFAVPIAVFFLPRTPIFGGTKHWFPAYPFLAAFAGVGVAKLIDVLRTQFAQYAMYVAPAALVVCLAPPLFETAHSHPFGLTAYVPLVGGTQGGAALGLNRQFWGFTTQSLAPYFARTMKPGQSVFIHDTTMGAFAAMQSEKRIPADIRGSTWSIHDTDVAIVHHELHMIEAEVNIETAYGSADDAPMIGPDYILTHDGVPVISVYKRVR